MKKTKLTALFLTIVLIFSLTANTAALSTDKSFVQDLTDIRAAALNATALFPETAGWESIDIIMETPLYDIDGTLLAYCIDLQNTETGANAYIIINADKTDFPILQFAPAAVSPYSGNTEDTALYLGAGFYAFDDGVTITNISSGDTVSKSDLTAESANMSMQGVSSLVKESKADYSDAWDMLSSVVPLSSHPVVIPNAPNWQWTLGCLPTAVGMQLGVQYGMSSTYITLLALYLKTNSNGGTQPYDVPSGTRQTIASMGYAAPSFCDWNSKDANGNPRTGSAYNPYSTYINEINAGRAVTVSSYRSTTSTPGYPNGWSKTGHAITGVGYYNPTGLPYNCIIAHTTNVNDGQVYFFLDNSIFDYAWFIVRR